MPPGNKHEHAEPAAAQQQEAEVDVDFVPQTRGRSQASVGDEVAPAGRGRSQAVTAPATKAEAVRQLAEAPDTEKVDVVLRMASQWNRDLTLAVINTLATPDNKFLQLLSQDAAGQLLIDEVIHKADSLASKVLLVPNVINGLALGIPGILLGFARRAFNMTTFTGIAIRQVFGIEFEQGSWSFEALRKMYLAFRMVPKTHVKGAVEKMTRNEATVSSDFGSKDKSVNMARLPMFLSMGGAERGMRVGNTRWMGSKGLSVKFLMKRSEYSQAMRSKNAFTMTALHEVGHAVDTKLGVMSKLKALPEFGSWEVYMSERAVFDAMMKNLQVEYPEEPAEVGALETQAKERRDAANVKGVQKDDRIRLNEEAEGFAGRAQKARDDVRHPAEREQYGIDNGAIQEVMDGRQKEIDAKRTALFDRDERNPDSHKDMKAQQFKGPEAMAKALFAGDKAKLAAFKNHPVMKAWDQGKKTMAWARSRAELAQTADAFGGRSFHQSYGHEWVSYDIKAKDTGVSHYAFRAPGEWFAELYAHYYMGTLKGHPMYSWFEQAIHNDEKNRPDSADAAKASLRSPEQVEAAGRQPEPQAEAAGEAAAEAVGHAGDAVKDDAGGGAKEGEGGQAEGGPEKPAAPVEEPQQAKAGGGSSSS
jgi:hypothetical protein